MLKRIVRGLTSKFRTSAASDIISQVAKDLAVASIIGAAVYRFPTRGCPNVDRAIGLVVLAGVFLAMSIVLKGGRK